MKIVITVCPRCGDEKEFLFTKEEFARFQTGEHVQNLFPAMSVDDRERLISGTCPTCWDIMFKDEED